MPPPIQQKTSLKNFSCFQQLPLELQNLVWEETFSQPRVFDDSTLEILHPQDGTIYSYLTPYALYVCRDSRAVAQTRLLRTFLFRGWPQGLGRMIYFNPNHDICVYRFTDLSWRTDFIPGQCLFNHIEIRANVSPDVLTSAKGYGLRSTRFSQRFPNLKRLLVRDRYLNLMGVILRNGWEEDHWNDEASSRQKTWDVGWKLVKDFLKERGIEIVALQEIPEAEGNRKAFMNTFPAHCNLEKEKFYCKEY
ncbi:hypothetical protein BGZ60DRAFT_437151 [Tricladium varicosporioides]|nr:hypothetical protein BGZ60DRAFT_437151 [Hymenoscyphus varicosporioides]